MGTRIATVHLVTRKHVHAAGGGREGSRCPTLFDPAASAPELEVAHAS